MKSPGSFAFASVLACGLGILGLQAQAATPSFTISATNVTMPGGDNVASSPFTLTSVNGYAGQVRVDCAYSGSMMGAKVPSCGIYVNPQHTLAANQTVQGSLTLAPYGKVINYSAASSGQASRFGIPALAAAIMGFFLIGKRLRNAARIWLLLLVLAAIGVAGLSGCAAGLSGTFPYTVTATDAQTGVMVSAPFTVTVP